DSGRATRRERAGRPTRIPPSDILDVEVTLAPSPGQPGLTKLTERPLAASIERYQADPMQVARAVHALQSLGFPVTVVSRLAISVKAPRGTFEQTFATKLSKFSQPLFGLERPPVEEFYFPPEGANWSIPPALSGLIDDAYIQWPPIYFENPFPPRVDYHHLRVPGDVALAANACRVHREGTTGKGVKVAMVDSGFCTAHPYFVERGYNMSVVLA